MRIGDAFKTSLLGLKYAKMRSFLTMLGIIIGISSVILLMSIGDSAQQLIFNQIRSTGSNLIFVIPGATKGSRFSSPASTQGIVIKTLVQRDLDSLENEPSIVRAAAEVRGQAKVVFENNDATVTYEGVTDGFFQVRSFGVDFGSVFNASDVASLKRVAVIGPALAETLFGQMSPLGKQIRLKNMNFTVIGILEKKGLGPFGIDQDNLVLIPMTVAQKQMLGIDHFNTLVVQASDQYEMAFAKQRIISILRQNHRIDDPDKDDFTVQTQEDTLALLGNITGIMTAFLTSIAFISLVVGGIGIMNIMLVSVIERTKEIGLRKAVGASNFDILQQFLLESVMLTFVGGLIGIGFGVGMSALVSLVMVQLSVAGWVFSLPINAVILAVAVSTFTGLLFGIYPARKAGKLHPIDALRYE